MKILKYLPVLALFIAPLFSNAQSFGGGSGTILQLDLWKSTSTPANTIIPQTTTKNLRVPSLGSTGTPCIRVNTIGTFSTSTCAATSTPSFDGPGTLQFASTTSGQFFSTSTLKYDTTTGFLGVGSSTPVAKLSVVGKINQNGSYAKFGSSEPLATCDIGT